MRQIAFLECQVESRMETGDHWVLYATVLDGKLQVRSCASMGYKWGDVVDWVTPTTMLSLSITMVWHDKFVRFTLCIVDQPVSVVLCHYRGSRCPFLAINATVCHVFVGNWGAE